MVKRFGQVVLAAAVCASMAFAADTVTEKKQVGMIVPTTGTAKMVGAISVKKIPPTTYAASLQKAADCKPKEGFAAGNAGYDQAYGCMMEKGFTELMGWMHTGNAPMGAALATYHQDPTVTAAEALTTTVAFPVAKGTKGVDNVKIIEEPELEVAAVQYTGDYSESGPIWTAIKKWVAENGYISNGAPKEVYLKGPSDTPVKEEWLTEIRLPVIHKK